jgi:Bardet-Biedl syndrome 9 protein
MSLFQTKEWWSTRAGADESFAAGALVVGNVDNSEQASGMQQHTHSCLCFALKKRVWWRSDKIVIGSLEGTLRIYHPAQAEFRIEDLVHEEDLGAPILQLCIGRLIP